MPIYRLQKFGEWKKLAAIYRLQKFGEWKKLSAIYRLQKFGEWKRIFSGVSVVIPSIEQRVTISSQTDSEGFVTLTGINYHWDDATSLTYFFQWSSDGGSSWSTINTGSIVNPSTGSSNTKTYMVLQDDVLGNVDNLYRFRVNAENANASNDSISENNITINAPRNIVIAYYSKAPTSITVEFDTPLYASSYQIKIGTNTFQSVNGTVVGGKTRVTATGLSPSTSYSIQVRGFTGILGSVFGAAYNKGYSGNFSNTITETTDAAPAPTQITAPTIPGGTGEALTQVTIGSSGTYNNQQSKTTSLVRILDSITPTNGLTTIPATETLSSPATISQIHATIPKSNFYTRDNVVGFDGNTYYFYSPALTTFIGIITDNYNRLRTPGQGLGVASSGYFYNSHDINAVSWTVNGSFAVSSASVPAGTTSSSNFAIDTFETNSANISVSMGMTTGSLAGYGASVWVTSNQNWWAVISTYDSVAYTKTVNTCTTTTCYGMNCCPANVCSTCTYLGTEILCVSGQGTVVTDNNPTVPSCSGLSGSCGNCTLSSITNLKAYLVRASTLTTTRSYTVRASSLQYDYTYPVNQTSTVYTWGTIQFTGFIIDEFGEQVPVYGCQANTGSGSSCPNEYETNYTAANVGKKCTTGCTSSTETTCTGSGSCTGFNCYLNAAGICGAATEDSYYPCNVAASTTGPCPTAGNGPGQRCTDCIESSAYECNVYAESSSCPGEGTGPGQRCSACEDITRRTYTYPKNIEYDKYEYGNPGTTTENGFTYNTRLQLVSSASGSVSYPTWNSPNQNGIIKTVDVAGTLDNNNFVRATGLYVVASGDTITSEGSNSNNDTFTQLVKTTSGVTKTEADGSSSAGIIKGYTASLSSEGGVDNLTIQ